METNATLIYNKHVSENDFLMGQNGFNIISGSMYITQSNPQFSWYEIYAVTTSIFCAKSYLGDDFCYSGSFQSGSSNKMIIVQQGSSIYGSFSAISQSFGITLAYRG